MFQLYKNQQFINVFVSFLIYQAIFNFNKAKLNYCIIT